MGTFQGGAGETVKTETGFHSANFNTPFNQATAAEPNC